MQPPHPAQALRRARPWAYALPYALGAAAIVVALFYTWFAVANRYLVFLYFHLGATPFDERTSTRYWMAGLVAGGVVLVAILGVNVILGRVAAWRGHPYQPPAWWRIWLLAAPLVAVAVIGITMTQNNPTLPLPLALACAASSLAGLALALLPGRLAAATPGRLVWLAAAGGAVALPLMLLRALELPALELAPARVAWPVAAFTLLAPIPWLAGLGWLTHRLDRPPLRPVEVLVAAACIAWLLLPLLHYLVAAPEGMRYITVASNFFAETPLVQGMALLAAGLLSLLPNWVATRAGLQPIRPI